MKTVQIKKQVKDDLDKYAKSKELSINKAMRLLLSDADVVDDVVERKTEYANIHIDDDLYLKLKQCKLYSNETHSATVERLLSQASSDKADD